MQIDPRLGELLALGTGLPRAAHRYPMHMLDALRFMYRRGYGSVPNEMGAGIMPDAMLEYPGNYADYYNTWPGATWTDSGEHITPRYGPR